MARELKVGDYILYEERVSKLIDFDLYIKKRNFFEPIMIPKDALCREGLDNPEDRGHNRPGEWVNNNYIFLYNFDDELEELLK